MNNSDSTDVDAATAPWPDLFEAMRDHSDTSFLQSIRGDLTISAPGHLSSAGSDLPNFNAVNDTAFTPAPTTSMGRFTNSTTQTNYTYPFFHDPSRLPDAKVFVDTSYVAPQLFGNPQWQVLLTLQPTQWLQHPTSLAEWGISEHSWPNPAAPATSAPVLALGKCRWDESHDDGASYERPPWQDDLECAGNSPSTLAGTKFPVDGELVEEESVHDFGSPMQQQQQLQQQEKAKHEYFKIPRKFKTGHKHCRNPPTECLGVTPEKADTKAQRDEKGPRRILGKVVEILGSSFLPFLFDAKSSRWGAINDLPI
ncbi:hypothetical protein DFH94DRAFT_681140 [Russula ochroleuca]|uniref:Uncharacterized protein n=1 Tax=Russula ochroleuca TaxID=152965 RepID=A0A9P5MYC7_9AGAM|nr:hypothetical protein DFH94DRAFT_681140 [Russula ochroleuca]